MSDLVRLLQIRKSVTGSDLQGDLGGPSEPVPGVPIKFEWQAAWVPIFDKQIALLREDIARAIAEDRVTVYLSCPLSGRGGGVAGTNVEVANHTQRRLMQKWGHRFWILNPAQYQLESKEGTGLIVRHARELGMTDEDIAALPRVSGGDYMRMWTKVLVEDRTPENDGRFFDAYYFLGPSDVREFLTQGGALSVTAGVEEFFARQLAMDPDFRDVFDVSDKPKWEELRNAFFRYYAIKASAAFSLGCHDEWNIFRLINERRLSRKRDGVPDLLAGYFDGSQIDPGAAATAVAPGYQR